MSFNYVILTIAISYFSSAFTSHNFFNIQNNLDLKYDQFKEKTENYTKIVLQELKMKPSNNWPYLGPTIAQKVNWKCYRDHKVPRSDNDVNKEDNIMELSAFDFIEKFGYDETVHSTVHRGLKERVKRLMTLYDTRLGSMFKFGHVKPIWHETNFALQINIPIVNNMYTFYSHKQMEQMVTELKSFLQCVKSMISVCQNIEGQQAACNVYMELFAKINQILLKLIPSPALQQYLNENHKLLDDNSLQWHSNIGVKSLLNHRILAESKFRFLESFRLFLKD